MFIEGRFRSFLPAGQEHGPPTVFVYACGPSKPLDGRTILGLCGEELQMLVRLTRSATVATFQEKEEGLARAWRGAPRIVVTHNCRTRTCAFPPRALRVITGTFARGR